MSDVITEMAGSAESYLYSQDRFNGPMDHAIIAALLAAEKAGWRLVPVEPTSEMCNIASTITCEPSTYGSLRNVIQAAPRPWDEVKNDS